MAALAPSPGRKATIDSPSRRHRREAVGGATGIKAPRSQLPPLQMPEIFTLHTFPPFVRSCFERLALDPEDKDATDKLVGASRMASRSKTYSEVMLRVMVESVLEHGTEAMIPNLRKIEVCRALCTGEPPINMFVTAFSANDRLDYDSIYRVYVRSIMGEHHAWVLRRLTYRVDSDPMGDKAAARAAARVLCYIDEHEDASCLLATANEHDKEDVLNAVVAAIEHGGLAPGGVGKLLAAMDDALKVGVISACFGRKAYRACSLLLEALNVKPNKSWFLKRLLRLRGNVSDVGESEFLDRMDEVLYKGKLFQIVAKAAVSKNDIRNLEALRATYGSTRDVVICDAVDRVVVGSPDVDCSVVQAFCNGLRATV